MTRHIRRIAAALALGLAAGALPAAAQDRTPSEPGARVYIISPQDGATVQGPVTVLFGLEGMGIAPAGVEVPATGHHHLMINVDIANVALDEGLPADDNHRHFGGGQTQATLDLPPGEHTLQLVLADHFHVPHDPPVVSEVVTITVE